MRGEGKIALLRFSLGGTRSDIPLEPTRPSCDRGQRRQGCAAPEELDLDVSARRGRRMAGCALLRRVGEVGVTSIKGARRRLCFLSALVEVAAFAFLATKLDDAAEGAIGGVADQAKTTATVGAPLHAILPPSNFAIRLDDAPRGESMYSCTMFSHTRFKRDSHRGS
jgi:hypothetical protein